MSLRFFDVHSHINDKAFEGDVDEVIGRMREARVGSILVGTDWQMSERAVQIAKEKSSSEAPLFAAIGLHPTDNASEGFDLDAYQKLAAEKEVVAIGECGLDYFRLSEENRAGEEKRQKDIFERQLEMAVSLDKPLMIHCRNAHQDMLEILASKKREHGEKLRGDIHFFSEGKDIAKRYFDLDFTVSFTGVITFARDYDEAIQYAPLDMILSETDCPYVAPVPYRGKRNEPLWVEEVVKKIAEVRGEDFEKVREAMVANAKRVFLKKETH